MAKNKNHHQQKPAQKDESKGLLARAADAIDHALHPDAAPKSEPEMVEASAAVEQPAKSYREHQAAWPSKKDRAEKSSGKAERCPTEQADFAKHPKFSKFKKGVN